MQIFMIRAVKGGLSFTHEGIDLFAYRSDGETYYCAERLKLSQVEKRDPIEPFLTIKTGEAQKLMDDLWDCGLRPSEGSGSAGSLLATQKHLDNMKTIAFHVLKIGSQKQEK